MSPEQKLFWENRPAPAMQALHDVMAERHRQMMVEGWTARHDDAHNNGELALAAGKYAGAAGGWTSLVGWPWSQHWWKPGTPRRMLVKAGALILAEIERLDRKQTPAGVLGIGGETVSPSDPDGSGLKHIHT